MLNTNFSVFELGVYIFQVISGACGAENVDNMWRTYVQELHQDTAGNKYHEIFIRGGICIQQQNSC